MAFLTLGQVNECVNIFNMKYFDVYHWNRLQTGTRNTIRSSDGEESDSLETNQHKIDVFDPIGAASFVNNLENVKTLFRRRFMYSVNEILYHEVIYEKLIGKFSQVYWELLFTLLGANEKEKTFDTLEKIHPESCHTKIPHWKKFRSRIINTDSYFACEMNV